MKEIEENMTEGWTIYPPEDAMRARRWMKTIDAVILPARFRDEGGTEVESNSKPASERERSSLRKGEKYS